ncbi:MAG: RNA-binding protein [Leptospiraceae bacterium]|nr:MAG: RNA-binding protein [Leptospiraceae bacterium]
MYILEIEAKSKTEALQKASQILDYDEKKLDYEVEGGLLGILSKKPTILKVKYSKDLPDFTLIRGVTYTSFYKLGIEVEIEYVKETPENFIISLKSEESGFIIGRQGKHLDAFQFLINLILNKILSKNKRVLVDVAHYREKRKAYLQKLARNLANKVSSTGRSYLMTPLNPYERRIIHLELEKDKRVTTESEGNGLYKRVRIIKIESKEYKKRFEDDFEEDIFDDI